MASLQDIYNTNYQPPSLIQADAALGRDSERSQQALLRSRLQREFSGRILPDVINRRASRGSFFSGQTTLQAAEKAEDQLGRFAEAEVGAQERLGDLLRNQFMQTVGLQI